MRISITILLISLLIINNCFAQHFFRYSNSNLGRISTPRYPLFGGFAGVFSNGKVYGVFNNSFNGGPAGQSKSIINNYSVVTISDTLPGNVDYADLIINSRRTGYTIHKVLRNSRTSDDFSILIIKENTYYNINSNRNQFAINLGDAPVGYVGSYSTTELTKSGDTTNLLYFRGTKGWIPENINIPILSDSVQYVARIYFSNNVLKADTIINSLQMRPLFGNGNGTGRSGAKAMGQLNNGNYWFGYGRGVPLQVYDRGFNNRPKTLKFRVGNKVLFGYRVYRDPNGHWVSCSDSGSLNNTMVRLYNDGSFTHYPHLSFTLKLIDRITPDFNGGYWTGSFSNQTNDGDSNVCYVDYKARPHLYGIRDSITRSFIITIGIDGTKWCSGRFYNRNNPQYLNDKYFTIALRDINPRPCIFFDSAGRTRPGRRPTVWGDTLFATSAVPNILLQDSSTSITLGVERVRWVFPAGSGIRAGDTAVGRSVAISVPRPGRYRIRVRVTDTTQAYSDTAFYITVRGQVQSVDESVYAGTPLLAQPNPTTGMITITGLAPLAPVAIYSPTGKLLWRGTAKDGEVYLSPYPPGLYLLRQGGRSVRVVRE
jgi:hypothetical protein